MTSTLDVAERIDHAKQPVSVVSGAYGHPVHPMLVTVPIGAWTCSLIFDLATQWKSHGSLALATGSYWLIGIGLIGALLAALFGLVDMSRLSRGTRALHLAVTHMTLNLSVVAMYAIGFAWRHESYYEDPRVPTGPIVLSAVALATLAASGWIGGMLAFRYGVRVAHEVDQAEAYVPHEGKRG
jgi:uncharacterized membrane protein